MSDMQFKKGVIEEIIRNLRRYYRLPECFCKYDSVNGYIITTMGSRLRSFRSMDDRFVYQVSKAFAVIPVDVHLVLRQPPYLATLN